MLRITLNTNRYNKELGITQYQIAQADPESFRGSLALRSTSKEKNEMMNVKRELPCNTLLMVLLVCMVVTSQSFAQESPAAKYEGPKENLHIYLLIGQSNMAGAAPFTKEESGIIQRCYLLNSEGKWEPAKNPLNRYSTVAKRYSAHKLSPGYTFAKTMINEDPSISIGLVVNARGGSKIEQWARDFILYKEALRRTNVAQKEGTLKGILWHQGEGNYNDPKYLDKLKALIADFRKDLNEPNLPFVAGQITDWAKIVNEQIAKVPAVVLFTGYVSSDGLTTMDGAHFDSKSMKILGQRYAEVMLEIHSKEKAEQKNPPDSK
jgi:Carbohydrate esterase, sialic acid-specific acetylesterase